MDETRYKKIRCPNCNKVITESELDYDFGKTGKPPTNRFLCSRCKKMIFYTIKPKQADTPVENKA